MTLTCSTAYKAAYTRLANLEHSETVLPYIGMQHELQVLQSLATLTHLACYHSVSGEYDANKFEVDVLLILPPQNLIIMEVKAYQGLLCSGGGNKWSQRKSVYDATPKFLKNPINQVRRTRDLFMQCLGLPRESLVVNTCVVMTCAHTLSSDIKAQIKAAPDVVFLTSSEFQVGIREYLMRVMQEKTKISKAALAVMGTLACEGIEPLLFDKSWIFPS